MLTPEKRKELVALIKQTPSEGYELLNFEHIRSHFPTEYTTREWVRLLCDLVNKGLIEVEEKQAGERGLFISVWVKKKENKELMDEICVAETICNALIPPKDLRHFHRLTGSRYRKAALFQLLEQLDASVIDLRAICRYVAAFFASDGRSVGLEDLNLSRTVYLELYEQLAAGSFLPEKQGLISVHRNGYASWFDNAPTPRMIKLLRNEPVPVLQASPKKQQGLLTEIFPEFLTDQKLHYNTAEQELFQNLQRLISRRSPLEEGALSVLLHGPSGTGKTAFVHQLAKQTGAVVLQLNFEAITSKWVGETQKNIQAVFDTYHSRRLESERPVFLLLNEADALMNRRVFVYRSNDGYHNHNQTQLLQALEDFEGTVFATTNLYKNIDEAFHRRFLFHLEVKLPERDTRERLLVHSSLDPMVSGQLRQALLEAVWSPAELKNAEQKIKLLRSMYNDWDVSRLEQLLQQSGLLKIQRSLGFSTRNRVPDDFNRETLEGIYTH